jgi:hypothetical protein
VSRAACDGRTVAARWLALIIIAQKSKEGGKKGRGVGVKARWDGICSQFLAPVIEGEAMDVRLRIEKKNGKTSKTR